MFVFEEICITASVMGSLEVNKHKHSILVNLFEVDKSFIFISLFE